MSFKPERAGYRVASSFFWISAEGGGTMILIKDGVTHKDRQDIVKLSVERVCEVACAETSGYIILYVYRPPSSNILAFISKMEDILKKLKMNNNILVCGDFNIDLLVDSTDKRLFLNLLQSFNLNCQFLEPTRLTTTSATCIDNVISNFKINSKELLLIVKLNCESNRSKNIVQFRPLTQYNLQKFSARLNLVLPMLTCGSDNPNNMFKTLLNGITNIFNKTCSVKSVPLKNKISFSAWATNGIRRSRDVLYELYDRRSFTPDVEFNNYVRTYSQIFKRVCRYAKAAYISSHIKNSDNRIKTTWKIINTETGKNKTNDKILLNINDELVSDKYRIANYFEHFFTNIPFETTKCLPSSPGAAESFLKQNVDLSIPNFEFEFVTHSDIIKVFKSLNIKSTEDLWGLSVKALQSVIDNIAPILAEIFNCCVRDGIFPDLMKVSKVVPIFKAGCSNTPSNFRPISILPALSKVFEKLMLNQMLVFFNKNGISHNRQFGFTKGRSTQDAGRALVKAVLDAWEGSQDALGVFCDLSKAFDCVDHKTLILKLHYYGIRGIGLKLISSYLSGRNQKVFIDNVSSAGSAVRIGVPQGSILGPFLFLVYINDLPYMVDNMADVVLFADDTSIIFKLNRRDENLGEPHKVLSLISDWFSSNNLLLNAAKTKCVRFSLLNKKRN
ncbi:hypothetical protein O3G_MSEX008022 [Manduca sexta]|uniref:Reverse transcriptase domain-containing protein n=1 Tax=Manduca sexta TaxID=7130 RepID=A0A922CP97_MANSE|nr:hypothetical protein O3G_MSEX008022 [Manduca sexta]